MLLIKSIPELTKSEYRACSYLNMRGDGMMMYSLMDNRLTADSHVIMEWGDGKLLGWALMIPHGKDWAWNSTKYQQQRSKYVVQFYVRKTHRRRGIGGTLMKTVKSIDPTPLVIPHDRVSGDFFANYTVVTSRDRRGIINRAKKRKPRLLTAA